MTGIGPGEIQRSLERIEKTLGSMQRQLSDIDRRLTAASTRLDDQKEDIDDLQDSQTWFSRALIFQFLAILVTAAVAALRVA